MKKIFVIFSLLAIASSLLLSQPLSKAQKDFTYTMVSENGTNASSVLWHPVKNQYFTVIAGNTSYPIESFDENGKSLYSEEVGVDCRGMWYNASTNNIEVNGYSEFGWASLVFNEKLNYHDIKVIVSGMNQPDANSCGTYYDKKKSIIFINPNDLCIDVYSYKNPIKIKKIKLQLRSDNLEPYNLTTVGYTGKKGYEFVLLNYDKHQLDYFNSKGHYAGSTDLPLTSVAPEMFRFAYANDRVFLYDVDERMWTAYKVF